MLREMMRRVLRQHPQTNLVLELDDDCHLPELLNGINARWLVVSLDEDGGLPDRIENLMYDHPKLDVLGVSNDGKYLEVITAPEEDRRARYSLQDISLNELISLLGGN
jgi:hypothetical protein